MRQSADARAAVGMPRSMRRVPVVRAVQRVQAVAVQRLQRAVAVQRVEIVTKVRLAGGQKMPLVGRPVLGRSGESRGGNRGARDRADREESSLLRAAFLLFQEAEEAPRGSRRRAV